MGLIEFVKSFFGTTTVNMTQTSTSIEQQLEIEIFAIHSAINLIAGSISKCEFKTYLRNEEIKGQEYYTWNVEPNRNQNSSQFLQELVSKLLFKNECLILDINGQLIIADSFYQEEFAIKENTFSNITKGTMSFDKTYYMNEVMYLKSNNTDMRLLLSNLMKGYNNLLNMSTSKYKRSGGRKGILDIDAVASGNKDFASKFEDLMNDKFRKYFEAENAVLPLEKGYKYEEQGGEGSKKSTSEIADINMITKEIFERVGQALKIPVALLRGDIADVSNITTNFLTFCIDPTCDLIREEVNRKRFGKKAFLEGSYLKIDTTCIKHIDLFSISEAFDKLVASSGYSPNELRSKCGDTEINEPWADQHYITKNYQKVEQIGVETTTTTTIRQ